MRATPLRQPRRRAVGTLVAAWATIALAASGTVLAAQPAAAADPAPTGPCTLAIGPDADQVELTVNVSKEVTDAYQEVKLSFSGKLGADVKSGCLLIPVTEDLRLAGPRSYDAMDGAGTDQVGTMVVGTDQRVRFYFNEDYLNGRTGVTFQGEVEAAVRYDDSQLVGGRTIEWQVEGVAGTLKTVVGACPTCLDAPEGSSKWAGVNSDGHVYSGVWIGTESLKDKGLTFPAKVTVTDKLGPGQQCKHISVWRPSPTKAKDQFKRITEVKDCSGDSGSITFLAEEGKAYEIRVTATITDTKLDSYGDTAHITTDKASLTPQWATASWLGGSASGHGTRDGASTDESTTPEHDPNAEPEPGLTPGPDSEKPETPKPDTPGTTTPDTPGTTTPDTPGTGTPDTPGTGTPSTPPVPETSTPGPNRQEKPWIPSPAPKGKVWRSFQVDRYVPRSAVQARRVAGFDDDGRLGYREDRVMWGASRWQFVTVLVPVKATQGELFAAINAQSGKRIGLLTTTRRLPSARAGQVYVMAWELGRDAAPVLGRAWGPRHTTPQTFVGRG